MVLQFVPLFITSFVHSLILSTIYSFVQLSGELNASCVPGTPLETDMYKTKTFPASCILEFCGGVRQKWVKRIAYCSSWVPGLWSLIAETQSSTAVGCMPWGSSCISLYLCLLICNMGMVALLWRLSESIYVRHLEHCRLKVFGKC